MTPKQALAVLDQATQPGVRVTRQDYVVVQQALELLATLLPKEDEEAESK